MESKPYQGPDEKITPSDYMPPADAEADIIVSDDEQSAYIGIRPPKYGGKDLTLQQLQTALERRRVLYGVNDGAVRELAEKPK